MTFEVAGSGRRQKTHVCCKATWQWWMPRCWMVVPHVLPVIEGWAWGLESGPEFDMKTEADFKCDSTIDVGHVLHFQMHDGAVKPTHPSNR
jgi:hypothetical protein